MYNPERQSTALAAIQDKYLIPATKLYIVVPEYNGDIPGIFKLFIDACSIREYAASFHGGKKAALVGVAAGRAGGLRGLESMTGFLNYLKINVLPHKLPISSIGTLLTDDQLTDEDTIKVLTEQVQEFMAF
jgi:NAD(P)H-dependent FMN reductase